jgi:hypothetical protein
MARQRLEIDQAFLDDPFVALRQARDAGPVVDSDSGAAVFRYEDMRALTTRIGCPTVGEGATWRPPLGINGPQRLPITFPVRGRRLTVTTA